MKIKPMFKNKALTPDEPLYHADHARPVTRRDFIRQGFIGGSATLLSGGVFSLFTAPHQAQAALSGDVASLAADINCPLGGLTGDAKIPFICFDLAGGANIAGSNVLVGGAGGQNDGTINTAGYSKLGIPGDMVPGLDSSTFTLLNPSINNDFVNESLGLKFHADSAMLMGILERAGAAVGNIDGCVIPARSANDTSNNPHNPLYGIAMAGGKGSVVDLIGSRSTDSGGNSMAPMNMINPEERPTKVDRPSDVTGMVGVGELTAILSNPADVTAVMESMARITHKKLKLGAVKTGLGVTRDEVVKDLVRCGYLKAADLADRFAGVPVDPLKDPDILSIFSATELQNDREFSKTASVMKMVLNGYSAGGCITMGGFDYHTSDRITGENRDLRAGRCIGACLGYAEKLKKPLMIYVFSDGSLASNGKRDNSTGSGIGEPLGGRGKGVWSGDNSSTACSFFLVYNPTSKPAPLITGRQIGRFSADASVITSSSPAANNVNLLVNTLLLNYMSLNNDMGRFSQVFPNHGLGKAYDQYAAFSPLA